MDHSDKLFVHKMPDLVKKMIAGGVKKAAFFFYLKISTTKRQVA